MSELREIQTDGGNGSLANGVRTVRGMQMRTRVSVSLSVLAVIFVVTFPVATIADHGPRRDWVVGGGQFNVVVPPLVFFQVMTLSISARSGPLAESPQGEITFVIAQPVADPAEPVHATVTCVSVVDNRAAVRGTTSDGQGILVLVQDNGEPILGHSLDGIAVTYPVQPSSVCPPPSPVSPNVDHGNFAVHDAVP